MTHTQKNIIIVAIFLTGFAAISLGGIYFSSIPHPFRKKITPLDEDSLSIGVVDINSIKTDSKVFQKFKEEFDGRNTTIHKEILEKETKLRAEYEEIKKREEQEKEPTPEILKARTELDKKVAELENTVRIRRDELYEDYSRALGRIKESLHKIMQSLGKTYHLKIILNRSFGDGTQMDQSIVLFCNKGLDLTAQVIQELDEQMLPQDMKK